MNPHLPTKTLEIVVLVTEDWTRDSESWINVKRCDISSLISTAVWAETVYFVEGRASCMYMYTLLVLYSYGTTEGENSSVGRRCLAI